MASELESFNARGDRQKEAVVLPTAEQLVDQERDAWQRFFGNEIDVPNPPQDLIQTLERLSELGILGFEAHYLPKVTFKKDDEFPGWKVKPREWFWETIGSKYWKQDKEVMVSEDAAKLSGNWVLIDGRPKPNLQVPRKQMYEDDFLAPLIEKLRAEGRVEKCVDDSLYDSDFRSFEVHLIPDDSRFGVSWDEIHQEVLPELAKLLTVSEENVRLPTAIEFNVIGNLHHPEWGETNSDEWLEDKYRDFDRLSGGHSNNGGLSYVSPNGSVARYVYLGFRPLVEFPQK